MPTAVAQGCQYYGKEILLRLSLQVEWLVNWDNLEPPEMTHFRYCCTQKQFYTIPGKDRPGTAGGHSTSELKVGANPGQWTTQQEPLWAEQDQCFYLVILSNKEQIQGVQIKFSKIAEVLTEAAVSSWAFLGFFGQS